MYYENKQRARTRNTDPTLTDQSAAKDTDINVIVRRFAQTGTVPGAQQSPLSGDFTQLPTDLRSMIELTRSMKDLRRSLPDALRDRPIEDLLALTNDQLNDILTPPAQPPATQENAE